MPDGVFGTYHETERRPEVLALLLNVSSFLILGVLFFSRNEKTLFHGLDGSYMMSLAREQLAWMPIRLGFGNDFFQGLGNVAFSLNTQIIPGYVALHHVPGETTRLAAAYTIFSLELFAGTLIAGRICRASWATSIAAAWLLPLITFPLVGLPAMYPITVLAPQVATVMSVSVVCLGCIMGMATKRLGHTATLSALLLLCLTYIAVSMPTALVLMLPCMAIFGVYSLVFSASRTALVLKIGAVLCILALLAVSGTIQYVLGILMYSAAYFFPRDLDSGRASLSFASIAFHGGWGTWLLVLALLGAALTIARGSKGGRQRAAATLTCALVFIGLGYLSVWVDVWRGPSPLYFEFLLWPFYAVFAVEAVRFAGIWIRAAFVSRPDGLVAKVYGNLDRHKPVLIAVAPWLVLLPLQIRAPLDRFHPYPPPSSPIVEVLRSRIALQPAQKFEGRVATFTGRRNLDRSASWFDLHALDYELIKKLGNDHRMVGLRFYGIPTLLEYNPSITPAFYLFAKRLLALPQDRQIRNVMALRNPDLRVLKGLGVRYVITDSPLPHQRSVAEIPLGEMGQLFLYELATTNIGNYSPTKVHQGHSVSKILDTLSDPAFDFALDVVLQERPSKPLIAATSGSLVVEQGGFRVRASSQGMALVLLPLEFSHCLKLEQSNDAQSAPRLLRANLLGTAVLFEGELDASLTYFTGPFQYSSCRLEDAREFQRLLADSAVQ